jgi:hypothetical protein
LTVVIGVRVPDELKRDLDKYGIEYLEDMRRLLEEKVRQKKREEYVKKLREAMEKSRRIEGSPSVQAIREARDLDWKE